MIRDHRWASSSVCRAARGNKSFGKKRSHVLDRLEAADYALDLDVLGNLMGIRPYDLTRRKSSPKGRDGLLVQLERAGIVAIEGNTVALTDDWLEPAREQRERGEEIAADEAGRK